MLWELLPFHNFSFSTQRMHYQLDSLPEISNDAWNIFQKRGMHFILLNINSFLSNTDEIHCIAKLTNAAVIELSETKLNNTVLSSEFEIEGYYLVRFDRCPRGGGVTCFVKNSVSISILSLT